jgi:hypothetical protein
MSFCDLHCLQVQSLSAQLDRALPSNTDERQAAAAPSAAASTSLNNANVSSPQPRLFTPRKSVVGFTAVNAALNMLHNAAYGNGNVLPSHTQNETASSSDPPISQPQSFKPIAGPSSSLIASRRSSVSSRPSTFLSSPSTTSLVQPKVSVPETTFPNPQFRHFQPEQQRVDAALSLKNSYDEDAEMWGECASPRSLAPPALSVVDLPMPTITAAPAANVFDVPIDTFDLVSPGGDVVQRSEMQQTNRADDVRSWDSEQRAQLAPGRVDAYQNQRQLPLRSDSPETIAIKEATAVRVSMTFQYVPYWLIL